MATRILAWLVNTFWGVVAASVIIVALFLSLGRYYVPLIDNFRTDFEKQIGAVLSADVQSEQLTGDWQGFNPIVGVERLVVMAATQAGASPSVVMSVSEAQVEIDMLRSLLALTPVYREALLVGLQLHFYKTASGTWTSPLFNGGGGVDIADLYGAAHDLRAVGTQLIFHADDQVNIISVANLSLERGQNLTQSMLRVVDEVNSSPLDVVVETSGRVGAKNFSLFAYLNAESVDLSPYRFLTSDFLRSDRASLSLWAQWRTGEAFQIYGKVFANTLSVGSSFTAKTVTADVGLSVDDGRWVFYSENIAFDNQNEPMRLPRFRLDFNRSVPSAKLSLQQIDLAQISDFLPLLPTKLDAVSTALQVLQPRGQLHNVALRVTRKGGRWVPSLLADAVELSVNSWRGAPAFDGVSGQLQHHDRYGWFESGQDNMTMAVPKLYTAPFDLRAVSGRVGWHLDKQITVASDGLRGESSYGQFDAAFTADISGPRAVQKATPTLTLALSVHGASAASLAQIMPDLTVTRQTKLWLEQGDLQGEIRAAKTVMHTSISKTKQWFPALQILVSSEQLALSVGSDWPRLSTANTVAVMSHRQLKTASATARLLDVDVSNLMVGVDVQASGTAVNFSGSGMGPIQSGLTLFQQTPLAEAISYGADGWTGEGDFSAEVAVGFVLETLPEVVADVQFSIIDSSISLAEADLRFEHVQGQIDYDNGTLNSQQLTANVFGEPWQAVLTTDPKTQAYYLDAHGDIAMRSIADWLEQPLLLFTQGDTAASAKLTIHQDKTPELELHTDLKGVAIDLPDPFHKPSQAVLPIDIRLMLRETLDVSLRSELMQFDAIIGEQLRGTVGLGYQIASLPMPEQGLLVTGHLKQLRADEATVLLERYIEFDEAYPDGDEDIPVTVKGMAIERLLLDEEFIETVGIDAHSELEKWFVEVSSEAFTASVQWLNDAPLVVDVEHLRYPFTPYPAHEPMVEWEPLLPSDLIAMDLTIDKFDFEGEAYGSWSANVRPRPDGVEFDNILGLFKNVVVAGVSEVLPASLQWLETEQGRFHSEFQGVLSTGNVKSVFEAYSLEPMLTSKRASAVINLSWPDEPFSLDHLLMSGAVNFRLEDGQFLRTEGAPTGLLKLLGVFNFDNLVRRMRLDFGDLVHEGLSYDKFDASLALTPGVVEIRTPLRVEGPSSDFRMTGALDLTAQTIDGELVAVVPVSKNLPWVAALAGGLPAAAGVYLASKVFSDSFDRFSSASYSIQGSWADPQIKFERLFEEGKGGAAEDDTPVSVESVEEQPE